MEDIPRNILEDFVFLLDWSLRLSFSPQLQTDAAHLVPSREGTRCTSLLSGESG